MWPTFNLKYLQPQVSSTLKLLIALNEITKCLNKFFLLKKIEARYSLPSLKFHAYKFHNLVM